MAPLNAETITTLLEPYLRGSPVPESLFRQLEQYLGLLERWNSKTNLTAIRGPREMVQRHFGESLFAGLQIPSNTKTLLDYGSGAGFPGLPIQLLRPEIRVTVAESQGKKAAFLREVVRSLGLSTEVWGGRVEGMPQEKVFDVVTLRAVDKMDLAIEEAGLRVRRGGALVLLGSFEDGLLIPGTRQSLVQVRQI